MPVINYEVSRDHRVPLRDGPVTFVKLSPRRRIQPSGRGHWRSPEVVHIEIPAGRLPYGGMSQTYCGREFKAATYFFVNAWHERYRTCKSCHEIAYRRNWAYRTVVDERSDVQLALADLHEFDLQEGGQR